MTFRFTFTMCAVVLVGLARTTFAQEASKDYKVDIKSLKAAEQQTPQIQVTNVKDKVWKPKKWLEVDVDLDAKKLVKTPGELNPMMDEMEVKYFVGLNKTDKTGKAYVLTATVTYANVPAKGVSEKSHLLMFASPATMSRLLDKPDFSAQSDIKALGVEVYHGGQVCGFESSTGKGGQARWWADLTKFSPVEGSLVPKSKTPFSVLWGDYDIETKPQ